MWILLNYNFEWFKLSWLGGSNLNVQLIKVWLDYGHFELEMFCILFVNICLFVIVVEKVQMLNLGVSWFWIQEMEDWVCRTNVQKFNS
jgi:hypothetical protein